MAFDGTWKVDRNENYEKFMEKMGINVVKRKLAAHDNLKLGSWSLEGNKLVGKFKRLDNGNELNTVREIIGGEMVQTYTYEGVEAKRIFKKE
ncbi:fatty acid-binding protein, intestinal [Camelus ferus]|nr:fatty acid-binding protein, intestinal [Camelus ferus]